MSERDAVAGALAMRLKVEQTARKSPAALNSRARGTMLSRFEPTPWRSTTAPPPGRPEMNQPCSAVAPEADARVTGSAARPGGGGPITARAGAER